MKSRYTGKRRSPQTESCGGFSLLEVIFAIVILAVGILSLAGLFAASAGAVRYAQEDHIAKQKAREAIEGVYSSRNDTSITFDQIQNISNGGIFKDGFQTMYLPGPNGIVGTGQDTTILDRIILPGKDGILNTPDDVVVSLVNYSRQILITQVLNPDNSVNSDLRRIAVTVRTTSPGRGARDYTITGFISRFP